MPTETAPRSLRQRILVLSTLTVLVLCAAIFLVIRSSDEVQTDDAYVQGNIVQVTAQIAGTVVAIASDDTQSVQAGMPLVRLNPVDYEVQLERAKATLAATVRRARVQFRQVDQSQAELRARRNDLAKASQDLARRQQLSGSGAVSGEEIEHAADVLANARAALDASQQQLAQRQALTDQLTLAQHPDVLVAASHVKDAYIALQRTSIPAPVSGVLSKRSVQVGQRIAAGTALMSVVPLHEVWVDANFKESQLEDIRIGQAVTLSTDVYGRRVKLHGTVVGLDAGTGSAFALLPAQNATGNWIKLTQRLPVRIALQPEALQAHPLRLGLSMHVSIDTASGQGNAPVTTTPGTAPGYRTKVFDRELLDADQLVQAIIHANAGAAAMASIAKASS